jgi:hypothetical protein
MRTFLSSPPPAILLSGHFFSFQLRQNVRNQEDTEDLLSIDYLQALHSQTNKYIYIAIDLLWTEQSLASIASIRDYTGAIKFIIDKCLMKFW